MLHLPLVPWPGAPPDTDPVQVRRFAGDLLVGAAAADRAGDFAAGPAWVRAWHGAAAQAYHASLDQRAEELAVRSGVLRRVAGACDDHAEAMALLLEEFDALLAARRGLAAERSGILREAGRVVDPVAAHRLRTRATAFRSRLTAWSARLVGLRASARSAEAALLVSLDAADGPGARPAPEQLAPGSPLLAAVAPEERRRWWNGLDDQRQAGLVVAFPSLVGSAAGLPAWARDRANRILLQEDLAHLRARDDLRERDQLRRLEQVRDALAEADRGRDPVTGAAEPGQLWVYDPDAFDGDGAVAVSVGDLDAAEHVVVQVPGFGNDLATVDGLVDRMGDLHDRAGAADPGSTTAAMAWSGYDAPDNLPPAGLDAVGVVSVGAARAGGRLLARDVRGLLGSRGRDDPHLTVVGHSYGSTVVGLASSGPGLPGVDETVFLGSPGVGDADDVQDLGAPPGHVWVGRNSRDPVTWLGDHGLVPADPVHLAGLGRDPADSRFGATRFAAEAPELGGSSLAHHVAYFAPGSESLDNLVRVVVGAHEDVDRVGLVRDRWYAPPWDPESR